MPTRPERRDGLSAPVPSPLVSTEDRVRALLIGGVPAWSRRLRRIEDLTDQCLREIERSWRALAWQCRSRPEQFDAEWRAYAARVDFSSINELIARHNRYFPAEANLRMDVRKREFVGPHGGDYRLAPLDGAWVLERFPPDLGVALRVVDG